MTARNNFLAEDHGLLPARPTGPRLDAPASDDDAWRDFPWAERDLRLLASPFARAVEDLRAATEPAAAAERVVPLVPHQVNRRLQVLAAALGLEGVSSHSGRRGLASELVRRGASTTAVQAAGRRLAQRRDGRPLRFGRRRRGRRRRQALWGEVGS